jgi:hypothetical protein
MRSLLGGLAVSIILAARLAGAQLVSGGGETMIAGGSGDPPQPLKTNFALRIDETPDGGVKGTFDCLALAPEAATGQGSGSFTHNVMYVTGKITELKSITKDSASFSGVATVTGIGAGAGLPFDCNVTSGPQPAASGKSGGVGVTGGGAGATMNLVVSGLTFDEVVTNGAIRINPPKRGKGK